MKLSRSLGLSDRSLSKLCKRHDVPTPGLGYWQQLASGAKLVCPPLPPSEDSRPIEFMIYSSGLGQKPLIPKIEVPLILRESHQIITELIFPPFFEHAHRAGCAAFKLLPYAAPFRKTSALSG